MVGGEAGWQVAGRSDGIGVFVWATGSAEDRRIGRLGLGMGMGMGKGGWGCFVWEFGRAGEGE